MVSPVHHRARAELAGGTDAREPGPRSELLSRGVWIFAYGSLLFRPGFDYVERRRAFVRGWTRRFWQGSPDHRGVPEAPGRVVTLIPRATETVGGAAYRIAAEDARAIVELLDDREQAGFVRAKLPLVAAPDAEPFAEGITWVAGSENPHFLGELPEHAIAAYVRDRRGPSGSNTDYVLRLAESLRALEVTDLHVERIAEALLSAR